MYKTTDFDFILPEKLIAQQPIFPRDSAKMAVLKNDIFTFDKQVKDLVDYLKKGDLIIFNDTKVFKAKLIGSRNKAKIEINLHKNISDRANRAVWEAFARPAKRLKIGDRFIINEEFSASIIAKNDAGLAILDFGITNEELLLKLEKYGQIPLPPYIKRSNNYLENSDNENYQTIYAKNLGAVAAPTAGLHFTEELLAKMKTKAVTTAFVTLNVGAGTFLPVKSEFIANHQMHSEDFTISDEVCDLINQTKKNHGRIIAVGTTSLRVLESAVDENGLIQPKSGSTQIFIYPPFNFKIVDILLTNFHLPKSTLLMLVSAFIGKEKTDFLYQKAIENNYRFYSYGDCCFLERNIFHK